MLDTLLFLAKTAAGDICTGGISEAVGLAKMVIKVLQLVVPIGMAKAVIAGDEKKMKEAQKPFVKRIIAAVIVFLIPIIVNMILSFVTKGNSDWIDCWNHSKWNGAIDVNSDQITTR